MGRREPGVTVPRRLVGAAVFGAILLVGFAVLVVALTAPPPEGPAIPELHPYVNDLSDPPTLTSDEVDALDAMCQELDAYTTVELAVLIVDTTQPWGLARYTGETFEANGIGKAGKDNGILLVISADERAWRIEIGYGLESVLTDSRVGRIGRDFLAPNLTAGDYYAGIDGTVQAISQIISFEYDPGAAVRPPGADWSSVCVPLALGVLVLGGGIAVLSYVYMRRHPELATRRRGPSVGGGGTTQSGTHVPINLGSGAPRFKFGGGRSGGGGAGGRY